ncbi:hypothetical protein MBEHAL_0520 [Halarchaeum acidiphilum MH1-52-1]|uniref:histidine kinase n=1 Tax=Halarchaeum acidiphilum MH1-52-1 TaxID=1261545 RepID=U2YRY9_9EURY|nr:hypothetical protein MBEHAL_0520 [Halarchaeum acidiphilum MH1-52-1]
MYTLAGDPVYAVLSVVPFVASIGVGLTGIGIARGQFVPPRFVDRVLLWMVAGIIAVASLNAWIMAGVLLHVPWSPAFDPTGELFSVIPFGVLLGVLVGIYDARRLDQQRSIRRLNRINETLRIATQEIVNVTDRDVLARAVCERLVSSDLYDGVWIGQYDPDDGAVNPVASAGLSEAYVESIDVTTDDAPTGRGAGGRAIKTGEIQRVEDVYADPSMKPWWDMFERLGVESLAVVPIAHDDTVYGFFSIYADRPEVFDERECEVLSELGDSIGHAVTSIEARDRLAERERELARQNERLEEFAAVVSHDLRSPLNVAEGFLDLARETGDDEHFDRVESALARMNDLIDDILTLARQGDAVDEFERVVFRDVVERAWSTAGTSAASLRIDGDLGLVSCDRSRLRQLLENLFRNAIEHGADDVTVTVGPTADGFYVADDGPGIPESERERVFDVGYTTAEGGTGFGLNIVREIADAHGWSVSLVESEDGGARFEFASVDVAARESDAV